MSHRIVSVATAAVLLSLAAVSPAASAAPSSAPVTPVVTDTGSAAGSEQPAQGVDEVSVTELEVVVPAVEPSSGDVVETPALVEAQAAPDAVAADQPVAGTERVESDVVETDEFQTLGVTWPADAVVDDLGVEVRARVDGQWGEWVPLEQADDAPDPGTADAASGTRAGTDSLFVGDADAVQLSFAAGPEAGPEDMKLALVDVPEVPAGASAALADSTSGGGGATATGVAYAAGVNLTSQPRIITRGEWGARPQVCQPDVAGQLVGAVVHHTAGSNNYATVEQAMQQIRGDQAYHIDGRKWCDIGYNFIVDKWGNIYEGRAGSMTQPVIGVHAGGFNTGTVGVSMLGNYSDVPVPAATQESVARLLAWRLAAYSLNPSGSFTFYTLGGENSRYPAGSYVNLPTIFAHRDVGTTACPGNAGYSTLNWVRSRATALSVAGPLVQALYKDMLGRGVDPGGLAGWSNALSNGTSAGQLAGYLAVSEEYATTAVRAAYVDVLRREPEADGQRNWVNAVMGGLLRPEDLRGALIASEEYYIKSGSTPAGYVTKLYQDILHRDPMPAELNAWIPELTVRGRGVVSHGVWKSLESARLRVDEAYHLYLGRSGDPAGVGQWAPVLQSRGEGALRSAIVDSDEYRRRAMDRF
ncbi:DUF4214 domain-containing protein [Actinotalea subterranea]|uniref:DUF4214 domain-containing protein n=1 Tax=Actinotalea subterranea TaxID=2607497 RepID=UPI0011EDE6C9|nr:DUF4214 domain-containing protein [Actinotalea subterranea]